ncbi:tyrosine-type recombinase/integrase [Vibrio sp. 99-70-13A1]|uniref:phage integrase n=1 Tax=Vibrio sp. 99-70-13A1 TaxID=2607601 RepID=UPI001493C257|nr:tyrosine-type recombinase/integrase [Vibrio sp. 99-70-13A1]NOH95331.1 tyrosine-type recombinase/integrase [Vibrio sp. 99-70-13A1]
MSIRNLKDSSKKPWLCECYPQGRDGKRVRKRFATKGEANSYEFYLMKEVDDKPWLGDKADHRRLSDLIELWFKLHGQNLKSGEHAKNRMLHISNALNNPIASHLTSSDLAHYRASRINQGQGREGQLAVSSNNGDIAWLKSIFNKLIKLKEWSLPNPVNGVESIKQSEPELTFLNEIQIRHLFKEITHSQVCKELTTIFKTCLATGARINEVVELKGSQLFQHKITFTNTKGKRNRTVPISKELYAELYKPTNDKLFSCGYGVAHKWLSKALPDLPKGQATHVLRHTFASHFMMNGGNILVLQHILGHQKIEQTMVYSHFSPNHLSDAIAFNPITQYNI